MKRLLLSTAVLLGSTIAAHAAGMVGFNGTVGTGSGLTGSLSTTNAARATLTELGSAASFGAVSPTSIGLGSASAFQAQGFSTNNAATSAQLENFAGFNGALVAQEGF